MTIWHCNLAVSLDGKLARPDGSVDDWLVAEYPPDNDEFAEFLASVDAIIMGRGTYDVVCRRRLAVSRQEGFRSDRRPLAKAHLDVETRSGDLRRVVSEVEAAGFNQVWVEGGGKVVRDMLAIEKPDILELAVIPIILGEGIPLFPSVAKETKLDLKTAKPWIKGAMHLVYHRAAKD